jgi:hypothetical protein
LLKAGKAAVNLTFLSLNAYAGGAPSRCSYKDRSDHRAQGGGTFVAKARAPVASGTSQAQDFTRADQQGGAVAAAPGATTCTGVPFWALAAAELGWLLSCWRISFGPIGLAYTYLKARH